AELKKTLEMCAGLPASEANGKLDQAQALVNELMVRTRKMSLNLRPTTLDEQGLLSGIMWYIEQYTDQTKIRVTLNHIGLENKRFAPELETAAYRIVQEALTNVALYAYAKEATVRVWATKRMLAIHIEDAGIGFNPQTALRPDSGLTEMRERALLQNGQLTID